MSANLDATRDETEQEATLSYLSHQMDVYPIRLVIAHGKDQWKAAKRDIPSLADDEIGRLRDIAGALTAITVHEEEVILAFWFPKKHRLSPERRHSTIAHEAAHGAAMIFEHISEDISSGEAFAYLVDWLFVKIQGHIETGGHR